MYARADKVLRRQESGWARYTTAAVPWPGRSEETHAEQLANFGDREHRCSQVVEGSGLLRVALGDGLSHGVVMQYSASSTSGNRSRNGGRSSAPRCRSRRTECVVECGSADRTAALQISQQIVPTEVLLVDVKRRCG